MEVVIVPTLKCNFTCNFCSQAVERIHKPNSLIDLSLLEKKLKTLQNTTSFRVYGGEITILPEDYLNAFFDILDSYNLPIAVYTNLYNVPDRIRKYRIVVGFNFNEKLHADRVIGNMLSLDSFHIVTVMTKDILRKDINELISFYETFSNLENVFFAPYITNEKNKEHGTNFYDIVGFLKKIKSLNPKFKIVNFLKKDVLEHYEDIVIDCDLTIKEYSAMNTDGTKKRFTTCDNCDVTNFCGLRKYTPHDDYRKCEMRELLSE